jgi:hypothetical protein
MWQLGKGIQEVLEKGKKMKWSGRNRFISSVLTLKPKVVVDYVITASNFNKCSSVDIKVDYVPQQETNGFSPIMYGFGGINMVGTRVAVISAIVIVWILIFILYLLSAGINARWHKSVTNSQWKPKHH